MLVINSNQQNATINSYNQWYPDFNQLLLMWDMNYFLTKSKWTYTETLNANNFSYVEYSRWIYWNDFTPALSISLLWVWPHTPNSNKWSDRPGLALQIPSWWNGNAVTLNHTFTYNIWMKNLPVWKTIGKRCYGSLLYYTYADWSPSPIWYTNISNTITFYAVDENWTKTSICSFTTTGQNSLYVTTGLINAITVKWWWTSNWYVVQEWDWLLCEIVWTYTFASSWTNSSGSNWTQYGWCCFWGNSWYWLNNIDWFRPFQCSVE